MLTMSTPGGYSGDMPAPTVPRLARPARKRPGRYHHGNLRQALIQAALSTIARDGVEAVTLRAVGASLGVSRSALYRHFADKDRLLGAVAAEGFRMLRGALTGAWERGGRGLEGFRAMGTAYVTFGVTHASHYRVMFGGHLDRAAGDDELREQGAAAFGALLDALVALQRDGHIRVEDPMTQACFVWATVHGLAMLLIAGNLGPRLDADAVTRYVQDRIVAALSPA